MTLLQDAPCIEPVLDTWRHMDHVATWIFSPRGRPATAAWADVNEWGARQLESLFAALRSFARVREALVGGPPDGEPLVCIKRTWVEGGGLSHETFERELTGAIHSAAGPVTTIELVFDLNVWVRTAATSTPTRGWVRAAVRGDLQLEMESPYVALMLDHTLFRDGATHGKSNHELHRLNNPLLCDALGAIQADIGEVTEFYGLPEVNRTGFRSLSEAE